MKKEKILELACIVASGILANSAMKDILPDARKRLILNVASEIQEVALRSGINIEEEPQRMIDHKQEG